MMEHSIFGGDQSMIESSGGSSTHYMSSGGSGERSSSTSLGCKRSLMKQTSSGYLSSDSFRGVSNNARRYTTLDKKYIRLICTTVYT